MSRRSLFYIVAGVVALHAIVFVLVAQVRPMPKPLPVFRPNFSYSEYVEVEPATGERTIYREINVSTKLAGEQANKAEGKSKQ